MATAARSNRRVDFFVLGGCMALSLVAIALPASTRDPISSGLRRTVVAPLVGLQEGAVRWRAAWVSSAQRQRDMDSLALRAVNAQALQSENARLRKLIGLGARLQWGFVPAEALHSTVPDEELITSLGLTAGTNAGVGKYSAVIAPEGLVGEIQSADPTMSIAILYTHPDFRASAMTPDGSVFGIAYPHQARVRGEDYLLELRDVPMRTPLVAGTPLYTSGLGNVYPRGIAIGTVLSELKTQEIGSHSYLVRPAVSPASINNVLILTAQRVTQGTGNVWGALTNADSATRHIAAAADSIGRASAALEAAAKKASLDSVRRVTVDSMRRVLGIPDTSRVDSTRTAVAVPARRPRPRVVPDTTRRDTTRRDTTRRRDTIPQE